MSFFSNNGLLARRKESISKLSGLTLWLDASDGTTIVLDGTTVSQWKDKSGNGRRALQVTSAAQPTTASSPSRVVFNKSTQKLVVNMPTVSGTMFLATPNGTQVYGVSVPAGDYDIGARGGLYMPDNAIVGQIICQGNLSDVDANNAVDWLKSKGGGADYGSVTNFNNFWMNWTELTSFPLINTSKATTLQNTWNNCSGLTNFPLIDTSACTVFQSSWLRCSNLTSFPLVNSSNGTNFANAWRACNKLTSFPLLDVSKATNLNFAWYGCAGLTSFPAINTGSVATFNNSWAYCSGLVAFPFINVKSGTDFSSAWFNCTNLTTFPPNFFDNCLSTSFANAFSATKLSQTSIDNILVSINSNNTSNGIFAQSGGSMPSSAGQSAITAMRSRGWTVTVTGGF